MEKCIKFAVQVTLDDDMLEKLGVSLADSLVAVDKFFKKYHFTKMNLQGETKQESFKEWKDRIEAISGKSFKDLYQMTME